MEPISPLLSSESTPDDSGELTLRPQSLESYIGQEETKTSLDIGLQAAKNRNEPLDHVLLYGPPGLGKTSLAIVIAKEMGANIRMAAGPAITRPGDLAALLTNLQDGDILFIDEIHRLTLSVEETLYPAMEDRALDIILGKGPAARSIRLDLPKFTLIGATTRAGNLSHPLRDRFGHVFKLEFYTEDELTTILMRSASILGATLKKEAANVIATRSRKTPRVANRLLKRVRDVAEVRGEKSISPGLATEALDQLQIDLKGLDRSDRNLLTIIAEQFRGGPVGLETLAAATGEEADTLQDVVEPFLLRIGFLDRTPRGRVITAAALEYLQQAA